MARLFDTVSMRAPKKNKFDLSHERKFSLNMADLVPIMVQEIVPGDSFRVNTEIMLRMAPMIAPIMHRVNVRTEYFFVPNRLVWDEWEDFITGGRLGTSSPVVPFMNTANLIGPGWLDRGRLADYLGLPTVMDATVPINISALPFRAFTTIWNEYYRDQNLTPDADISKASGQVVGAEISKICQSRTRCWEKDYFTSALPFAQRGPEVLMPMEGTGTVNYTPTSVIKTTAGLDNDTGNPLESGDSNNPDNFLRDSVTDETLRLENIDSFNLTQSSVTINELRRSIRLQEWLEKNARGGGRYVEQILSHFGVRSSDARLQRPEYLGGGKTPVVVSEVLSSFQDDAGSIPQGNMAGHGQSYGTHNGFKRTFEEHGFVIGIMSVLPRTAYQQGLDKKFQRFDRFDYYWPEFANIGEQEVKAKELFYDGSATTTPEDTFGYQSRYAEYKYGCSSVHGEFKATLAFWHMGRIFSSQPVLDDGFVTADPTTRIFAVEEESEHLYCHLYNKVDALRPMPYFGTPTL